MSYYKNWRNIATKPSSCTNANCDTGHDCRFIIWQLSDRIVTYLNALCR